MRAHQETLSQREELFHNEAQLINQFQQGDSSVFNQLVIRYQSRIFGLALRYVKNPEDAYDLTQDAFLRAYQGLKDFKSGESQFYAWLHRIATNLCIDFIRRNRLRKSAFFECESMDEFLMNVADCHSMPASKAVENQELFAQIHNAITQLSPQRRKIFILYHLKGFSLKEIAHQLERTTGAVKANLFHARRNLREALHPYLRDGLT